VRELFDLREDPGAEPAGQELAEVHELDRRRSAPARRSPG
jgi:hypothetical protein